MNPRNWPVTSLSEAVVVNPKIELQRGSTYPFVDMASVSPDRDRVYSQRERVFTGSGSRFEAGDTLMARITPCLENGKTARYLVPAEAKATQGHGSTEFIVLRARPGVTDPSFVYYLSRWERVRQYAIGQMTGTSGRQRVPTQCLDHLFIPLATLPEQRAIANVLETVDEKIELNRQIGVTLEEVARAVFKSWFVDFDPTRAKIAGDRHLRNSSPSVPAQLYRLFPNCLVASELGPIPRGWTVSAIEQLGKVVYGAPFASKNFNNLGRGLPVIRIRDLKTHSPSVFTEEIHKRGHIISTGDIVIGMDGEFKACLWKGPEAWLNQRVCHIAPLPEVPQLFALLSLSAPLLQAEQQKTGTTVIHLNKSDIEAMRFIVPPPDILDALKPLFDCLYEELWRRALEMRTLVSLRDALLPQLLSGSLRLGSL